MLLSTIELEFVDGRLCWLIFVRLAPVGHGRGDMSEGVCEIGLFNEGDGDLCCFALPFRYLAASSLEYGVTGSIFKLVVSINIPREIALW